MFGDHRAGANIRFDPTIYMRIGIRRRLDLNIIPARRGKNIREE